MTADALVAADVGIPGIDLLGGSVLGVVVLLLMLGWLWPKPAVDRLLRDNERLVVENTALRTSIEERVIPAVEKDTYIAERVVDLLEDRRLSDRIELERLDRAR